MRTASSHIPFWFSSEQMEIYKMCFLSYSSFSKHVPTYQFHWFKVLKLMVHVLPLLSKFRTMPHNSTFITSFCIMRTLYLWEIGPNRNVLLQIHLFCMTIFAHAWSSSVNINVRWCSFTSKFPSRLDPQKTTNGYNFEQNWTLLLIQVSSQDRKGVSSTGTGQTSVRSPWQSVWCHSWHHPKKGSNSKTATEENNEKMFVKEFNHLNTKKKRKIREMNGCS